jgi:hypothetical protein
MALTQAQWFAKLKSFVPGWKFDRDSEINAPAVYQGTAQVLSEADGQNEYFIEQTFILTEENPYLALQGFERGLTQLPLESDAQFKDRVRNIKNITDLPDLQSLVDSQLIVGVSTFIEHFNAGPCLNRHSFLNRDEIFIEKHYNWFTVIVPPQKHPPYSFLDVGNGEANSTFGNRGFFAGSDTTLPIGKLLAVIDQILAANKAFGVAYRLYEGTH